MEKRLIRFDQGTEYEIEVQNLRIDKKKFFFWYNF